MNYEPQGIQQQGRIFEIGEEKRILTGERGKSQIGKNRSRKLQCRCENCGTEFYGRRGETNRFCQNSCQHEFSVKRWLECSKCLAGMGIGSKTAGKILGIGASSVSRGWKNYGVKRNSPPTRSMINEARIAVAKAQREAKAKEGTPSKDYEKASMEDIRSHRRFPDWSYLWTKEKARRHQKERYHSLSKEDKKEWNRLTSARNPERRRYAAYQWKRSKRASCPIYRMIESFRSRLSALVRSKEDSTKSLIGCSPLQLRSHLEFKFKRGMTWDNYGTHWHVDHILPCASFDHSDPNQVRQCWHWTNLQPLEAEKNMEKSSSIINPQMSLMLCSTH